MSFLRIIIINIIVIIIITIIILLFKKLRGNEVTLPHWMK